MLTQKLVTALIVMLAYAYPLGATANQKNTVFNNRHAANSTASYRLADCNNLYQIDDTRQVCGYLFVPENYRYPKRKQIKVPFLIIAPNTYSDSTFPLFIAGGGGPGNAMLDPSGYGLQDSFWTYNQMSIDDGRALVIVENRGVGLSAPSLRCNEYTPILATLWQQTDTQSANKLSMRAESHCVTRLTQQGIDLSQYNAVNAARDIEQLRILLNTHSKINSSQLNLYGVSYGTHIAMLYESMYPQQTRTLILDSVTSPFELPAYSDLINAQRAFDLLFSKCRNDALCANRYGKDLESYFYRYLEELNVENQSVTLLEPVSLKPVSIPLTPATVVSALHGAMYSQYGISNLPAQIYSLINGVHHSIAELVATEMAGWSVNSSMYDAAYTSYLCFDVNYEKLPILDTSTFPLHEYSDVQTNISYMRELCREYGIVAGATPPSRHAQITSPVLLLSGQLDPVTPATNAHAIQATAVTGWHMNWPNVTHDVISNSDCARLTTSWFLFEPHSNPASHIAECLYPITRLYFRLL